jgi:hypothetical protein
MRTVLVATEYTVIFADIKIDTIIIIDIIYWFFTSNTSLSSYLCINCFQWLPSCPKEKSMTACICFITYYLGRKQR